MQLALRTRQARPRADLRAAIRQHARQLGVVAGEVMALVSLAAAVAAGLLVLTGLLG